MNAKTIGTVLITGLIVCSAMVVFATPAMAKGDPPPGDHSVWSWAPGYCTAYYSTQSDEHLGNHPNRQMDNQDDLVNIDQTGVSWTLNGDGTMDITVKVWTDDMGWNECLSVWIDWDGDNTFEDSEIVAQDCRQYPASEGYTYLAFPAITIPSEAVGTTTYLRAVLDFGTNLPGPCEVSGWGDVEDYEITFPQDAGNCCVCPTGGAAGDHCVCTLAGSRAICEDESGFDGVWAENGCDVGSTTGCEGNVCTGDGGCEIPEFSTIALPVASILGLLFFFNYRKRRKEQ